MMMIVLCILLFGSRDSATSVHAISLLPRSFTKQQKEGGGSPQAGAADFLAAAAAASSASASSNLPLPSLSAQLLRLLVTAMVGFGTDPLVEALFNVTYLEEDNDDVRHTFLYGAADSLSYGARATGLVLTASLLKQYLGIPVPFPCQLLTRAAPQIGAVVWTTLTLCTTKRTLLQRMVQNIQGLGRVGLFNKMMDLLLGMGAAANIMKLLEIDLGLGFQSLFAASGVSALVFSLASRGLLEQIASGFILQAWDAIEEGEEIRLGDGTTGTVKTVGLVETILIGGDDVATRIPNSEISKQRIANLSRVSKSQFKQVVRFQYSDLRRIPSVLDTILQEIEAHVDPDALITDGSKPFRAVLTQYEPDHVQAEITCNFHLKPGSAGFVEARQQVLLSIARAVDHHQIEFAIPSIRYHTAADEMYYNDSNGSGSNNGNNGIPPMARTAPGGRKKRGAAAAAQEEEEGSGAKERGRA